MRRGIRIFLHSVILIPLMAMDMGSEPIQDLLDRAANLEGRPYRNGGMDPTGFDCSGYVNYLYKPSLPNLPRTSRQMAAIGKPVDKGNWRPCDLLFYATGANPNRINHVAIWYSDGYIIHSISGGPKTGVVISPADSRYWSRRYVTARRVLPWKDDPSERSIQPKAEKPTPEEESFWEDFEGVLQGDYESWQKADDEAFEAYKRKND